MNLEEKITFKTKLLLEFVERKRRVPKHKRRILEY